MAAARPGAGRQFRATATRHATTTTATADVPTLGSGRPTRAASPLTACLESTDLMEQVERARGFVPLPVPRLKHPLDAVGSGAGVLFPPQIHVYSVVEARLFYFVTRS